MQASFWLQKEELEYVKIQERLLQAEQAEGLEKKAVEVCITIVPGPNVRWCWCAHVPVSMHRFKTHLSKSAHASKNAF